MKFDYESTTLMKQAWGVDKETATKKSDLDPDTDPWEPDQRDSATTHHSNVTSDPAQQSPPVDVQSNVLPPPGFHEPIASVESLPKPTGQPPSGTRSSTERLNSEQSTQSDRGTRDDPSNDGHGQHISHNRSDQKYQPRSHDQQSQPESRPNVQSTHQDGDGGWKSQPSQSRRKRGADRHGRGRGRNNRNQ